MGLEHLKLNDQETKKSQHVHFDERIIAEHDKDRGTRMPIDEPDTPFARSPLVSESEDEHGSLKTRGSSLAFNLDVPSPTSGRSEDEHAAFKAKRKAHYNEFKMAKSMDSISSASEAEESPHS